MFRIFFMPCHQLEVGLVVKGEYTREGNEVSEARVKSKTEEKKERLQIDKTHIL